MKIALFGATGKVGRKITEQALENGHHVTALVRSDNPDLPKHENLTLVIGDVLNHADVARALEGQDAALVALGKGLRNKEGLRAKGTARVIEGMKRQGLDRLICLSGFGAGESHVHLPWVYRALIMPLILKHVYADHEQQELIVKKSDLNWTLVRPTNYFDGPRTGAYKVGFSNVDKAMKFKISHADVADFMVHLLGNKDYDKAAVAISA